MRATILVDNLAARGLEAEWGLSIYVEYQGHAILLDTGASDPVSYTHLTLPTILRV